MIDIAVTCGDPAGIGPIAVVKALMKAGGALRHDVPRFRAVLVGEELAWRKAGWRPGLAPLVPTRLGLKAWPAARPSRRSGVMAFSALRRALDLVARGTVKALVTAPLSKIALSLAGLPHEGQTEYLASAAHCPKAQMILLAPRQGLRCVTVTRHIPLSHVPGVLRAPAIADAAGALFEAVRRLGDPRVRLGLCALNPHAGESGLFGGEETGVLAEAAALARRRGIPLSPPTPADAAWHAHRSGNLSGLVCLYHDQALIALKAAAGFGVVNWTVGLPFVRTSPGHGTGFDLAASSQARARIDDAGTVEALRLAAWLCRKRYNF
jgi:4-hydroxythreonine-4-phosphate dehydrogenase